MTNTKQGFLYRFLALKKVADVSHRLLGFKIVPWRAVVMNTKSLNVFLYLQDLFARVRDVPGEIVECGVGAGRTFYFFVYLATQEGKGRKVYGFDSFEGFPEPSTEDESHREAKKGICKGTSPQDILDTLSFSGIPDADIANTVRLEKGFFNETLARYPGTPIALLHLDVDLYQSYKEVLEALVPFVAKGGFVLFDEYHSSAWPGATKAIDEFLAGTPWKLEKHPLSKRYFFQKT